jgi:hypothetical protein
VAQLLVEAGLATLLMDLLTTEEESVDAKTASLRFVSRCWPSVSSASSTGQHRRRPSDSFRSGFAVAYPFAFLANRYMIARGRGCAMAHQH